MVENLLFLLNPYIYILPVTCSISIQSSIERLQILELGMENLSFCYTGLPPEVKKKAELELGETNDVKERALKEFREIISEQHDINTRLDDVFLLRFLRTKKYDLEKALKVLRNYHTFKTHYYGKYSGRTPADLMHVLEMKYALIVPQRVTPGSHVCVFHLGRFDLQKAAEYDMVACCFLLAEICLQYELSQVCGGNYVVDFKGTNYGHYTQFLNIPFAFLVVNIVQDCWPERIKGIHLVNEPMLLHIILNAAKIFMTKKVRKKFVFHGSDLSSLHAHIPKDLLPEHLGGTSGPFDDKDYVDFFIKQQSYFEENNKYGIVKKSSK